MPMQKDSFLEYLLVSVATWNLSIKYILRINFIEYFSQQEWKSVRRGSSVQKLTQHQLAELLKGNLHDTRNLTTSIRLPKFYLQVQSFPAMNHPFLVISRQQLCSFQPNLKMLFLNLFLDFPRLRFPFRSPQELVCTYFAQGHVILFCFLK